MTGFGFSAGKNHLTVGHVQVVALYDPDGTIRHVHTVTTMRGADPVTQDHAIAEAKRHASRRHKNSDALAVALSDDVEHARRPHRIDPKTKSFVPVSKSK
jgi:hypothetical protein